MNLCPGRGTKAVRISSDVDYCYIARMTDGTEVIYYTDLDGMLDYVEKTIGK